MAIEPEERAIRGHVVKSRLNLGSKSVGTSPKQLSRHGCPEDGIGRGGCVLQSVARPWCGAPRPLTL